MFIPLHYELRQPPWSSSLFLSRVSNRHHATPAPVYSTCRAERFASSRWRRACFIPGAWPSLDARTLPRGREERQVADRYVTAILAPTPCMDVAHVQRAREATPSCVAIHPQFAENNLVYMSYPKQGPQGTTLAVARGRLKGATSRKRSGDLRCRRLGNRRQPGRADSLWPRRLTLRDRRRPRSNLLQRHRRQQSSSQGAGSRQSRRQNPSAS